jgi:hypothetical protein
MDISKLSEPLAIDQIDFRIQSINKGGYATILAYKDARVDINRLNTVCGPLGWMREHKRDNHNCVVSVWDDKNKQWVSKEDTGTESNAEAQKGLASDSFKRACFNWGIGLELYDYPLISIKLKTSAEMAASKPEYGEWYLQGDKAKQGWGLKLKDWVWYSEFEGSALTFLAASDGNSTRFKWGKMKQKEAM